MCWMVSLFAGTIMGHPKDLGAPVIFCRPALALGGQRLT